VRGVRDEGALPGPGRLQPVEHPVEGDRQAVQLVRTLGHRQPADLGRADLLGTLPQLLDRAQRPAHHPGGQQREGDEQEGVRDEQPARHGGETGPPVPIGRADQHGVPMAGGYPDHP
jgi:hypothetical protein